MSVSLSISLEFFFFFCLIFFNEIFTAPQNYYYDHNYRVY